jgi:holliday junction DNA helicase RuvA
VIASLRGQLKALRNSAVIVEVGGVGYLVHVPTPLLNDLGHIGQVVELYVHTHVRENELALYGFRTQEELDLFDLLLGVTGIGPRTALAILAGFSPETLRGAIAQGDVAALTRVPGIGRKTAQRLLLDLKDKVSPVGALPEAQWMAGFDAADADVVNALTALGYSVAEAQSALAAVSPEVQGLDARILAALRVFGSR